LINCGPLASQFGGWPRDSELIDWYRAEVDLLVESLGNAPDDIETAMFLPAESPKHFWARRQCHEVEIHRVDAELVVDAVTPIDHQRAADGIDELLMGFVSRTSGKLRSEHSISMAVAPDDALDRWTVVISSAPPAVSREMSPMAHVTVSGPVDMLFRCLWNRATIEDVRVDGDPQPLVQFKSNFKVRWS
jgi:uncharacterized protein (TIGR03083 family)